MKYRFSGITIFLAAVLFVLIFFLPQLLSLYVDWLWFQDIQYEQLFTVKLNAQILSSLAGLISGFVIVYVNLLIAAMVTKGRTLSSAFYSQQMPQLNILKHIDKLTYVVPALMGFFTAFLFYENWFAFLYFMHAEGFGYADPVFGRDISFYVFRLPVLEIISNTVVLLLGVSLVVSLFNYVMKGAVIFLQRGVTAERPSSAHLSVLGGLIFLIFAFKAYVSMHAILYSSDGLLAGATYTDVYARIPFLKVQIIVACIVAVLIMSNIFVRRTLVMLAGIGVYVVVSVIGNSVYPSILQKFIVAPNELVKETPFIKQNIAATRKGFGIDTVEKRNIPVSTTLDSNDIGNNSTTVKNIRLWDHRPLLDTFSQVQEIRTYYEFTTVGNDRYMINGEYRQTMLSPRELSTESIPTRNWINETLTFTHGYGVTLGPVNQVTPEGLPVLLVKDIPPVSSVDAIQVTRPQIYFGKLTNNYVIVNTKSKEFDYPSGEKNVFTEYAGERGVVIDSFLKKLVFAVHFNSMKLFLSNDVTRQSKALYVRNIRQRVHKAMPFLMLDGDPYMVISDDGHLFWIYDAYTGSDRFPYSEPLRNGINYIRNSVKAVINAFDGSMDFYIADADDPVIRTIDRIFPDTLKPLSEMPADLRRHIRYPLDIFGIQTAVYSTYHMEEPQIFYNREDKWEIPVMGASMKKEMMEPYYTIMKLPGEEKEEFILMLPFNPKKKDNLSAWMVARSDEEHYGRLVVYRFPKDRLVYGPKQIVARINQDTEISKQVSLWDQRGSQVIQGTLLVIPIENSLIYVQPLYLRAETGKIPELKRVIVAYENRIAMEETLERALSKIFGEVSIPERIMPAPERLEALPPVEEAEDLAGRAQEHFNRAVRAQREGNWALYGEELRRLGEVIRQMQK